MIKTAYELSLERIYKSSYVAPKTYNDLNSPVEFVSLDPIIHKKPLEKTNAIKMIDKETITYPNDMPELHWYGNFTSHSGFSRMNRTMVFGLANRFVRIKIDPQDCPIQINEKTMTELNLFKNVEIDKAAPKIFGATIPLRTAHYGKKILYTMMENSGQLHKEYVDRINCYNEIWVPTNFNKKQFIESGVNPDIKIMPLGVDIARYKQDGDKYDFGVPLKSCVFLSVFKWNPRKGWDSLLKTFLTEFNSSDDVSLVIVSRVDVLHNQKKMITDFENIRRTINKEDHELPHVVLCDREIPERQMPSVYRAANAFVLMTHGEGFCLPICEAAATGIPIITTNCTAMTDYMNKENSFLVDPDEYVEAKIGGSLSNLAKHCLFYENQKFPYFGKNALEQTMTYMRDIYENYNNAYSVGINLTNYIRENYSWNNSIDRVFEAVLQLKK